MKRILTIQDMSCVGKCSLTVALPVLSAFGIEACPMPTAVLSNHTAFPDFKFYDLTNEMTELADGIRKQGITFDGIYTGYLGSAKQIEVVKDIIKMFGKEGMLVLVDPAMADFGKLYKGFPDDFPQYMARLCREADIIVPNMTEAGLLLGKNGMLTYSGRDEIKAYLRQLTDMGPKTAVITGYEEGEMLGAAAYDRVNDKYSFVMHKRIKENFHGTGDVFASVLFGGLIKEMDTEKALESAVEFVCAAMEKTTEDTDKNWYGVNFEEALPLLTH